MEIIQPERKKERKKEKKITKKPRINWNSRFK